MTKKEIDTKLEIAEILVKHLDCDTSKALSPLYDYLQKQLTLQGVGSSLPKVCKGCGSLSTKVIDKKYLACCPDNNYVPMEDYCKNSIYPEKQF